MDQINDYYKPCEVNNIQYNPVNYHQVNNLHNQPSTSNNSNYSLNFKANDNSLPAPQVNRSNYEASCSSEYYTGQTNHQQFNNCLDNRGFYDMVNESASQPNNQYMDSQMDSLGEKFSKDCEEPRTSVLQAIMDIDVSDIPLRCQIIDLLRSSGDPNFDSTKPMTYKDYVKIENFPTFHRLESERFEELKNACLLLQNPYKQIVNETHELRDALKVTEAAIRRLIKMSKRLSSFNRLSQNDQISLLKCSIIEMMCIRATTNFNCENNFWYFIDDKNKGLTLVSMEVLKDARVNFISHKNFAIKFNSQFQNDSIIADLLTAIILFRPSHASVTNKDIIRDEFLNYCYLLRRYLQIKYNGDTCKAKSSYIALMHRLEELYYLSEDIVRMYMDMDPGSAGPLFVELFDLK